MSILFMSTVSIGFYGDDLEPEQITISLGDEPTVGVKKGEACPSATGASNPARTGSWRVSSENCQPGDVDGQINALFDGLSNNLSAWKAFAQRYRGRVFCGIFLGSGNEGLTLRPETLLRIGERGLLVDLDIYERDVTG
ncbi:DUF4279 domain-containing protein [Sphingomonas floccifaciens]|uniref:DUF4279 domain-containing protein n=2 Tax=Sphingomonas floccifaciens TaxID=1844115 RepID=A0ABW4N8H6_9SPHN